MLENEINRDFDSVQGFSSDLDSNNNVWADLAVDALLSSPKHTSKTGNAAILQALEFLKDDHAEDSRWLAPTDSAQEPAPKVRRTRDLLEDLEDHFKPAPKVTKEDFIKALSSVYRDLGRDLDYDRDRQARRELALEEMAAEDLADSLLTGDLSQFQKRLHSIRTQFGEEALKRMLDAINKVSEDRGVNLVVDYTEDGKVYISNKTGNGEAMLIDASGKADRVRLVIENGEARYEPAEFRRENRKMHEDEFSEIINRAFGDHGAGTSISAHMDKPIYRPASISPPHLDITPLRPGYYLESRMVPSTSESHSDWKIDGSTEFERLRRETERQQRMRGAKRN